MSSDTVSPPARRLHTPPRSEMDPAAPVDPDRAGLSLRRPLLAATWRCPDPASGRASVAGNPAARDRSDQRERPASPGGRTAVFTLNFIVTRLLNPLPAYRNMSNEAFAMVLLFVSVCYLFFTDAAFSWRELTHRRA